MVDDTISIISCWVISIAVLMFLGRTLQPISSSNFTISFHNSYYSSHDPLVAFDQKVELNSLDKLISPIGIVHDKRLSSPEQPSNIS